MIKAVIYARYSSAGQRDVSIEQQVKACMLFAQREGYTVVGVYDDHAITGKTDDRPKFQQMIRDSARREWQLIIVYMLDRFARNRYDSAIYKHQLRQNGVRVVSAMEPISDDPTGILIESMLEGYAEYYSAELSRKIRRGYENNAEHFLACGSVPFGYNRSPDGHYVINESEAAIVREIFARVRARESFVSICDDLNARGILTKHKTAWNRSSFNKLLSNERYIGTYIYKDKKTPDAIPSIVSKEAFYAVQTTIDQKPKPRHSGRRRTENGIYLLTGKLYCGTCGERMVGISGTCRDGSKHHYYACQGHRSGSGCAGRTILRDQLEKRIAESLHEIVLDDDCIEWMAENAVRTARDASAIADRDLVTRQLEAARKEKDNALRAILAGIINDSVKEALTQRENEIAELTQLLAAIDEQAANIPSKDDIVSYLELFREGSADDDHVRMGLLDAFVIRAELFDDHVRVYFSIKKESRQADIPIDSAATVSGSYSSEKWTCGSIIRTEQGVMIYEIAA